jgi:hypothetical protein
MASVSKARAVGEKASGSYGLRHIKGSIVKCPKVCRILAAEWGEELIIHHKFSTREQTERKVWIVFSTMSWSEKSFAALEKLWRLNHAF